MCYNPVLENVVSLTESQSNPFALSRCQCDSRRYVNGSTVLVLYFHLIDQIGELLQSYDYKVIMDKCRTLMASDYYNIKLFSSNQLKTFSEYNCFTLLRMLCLCSWNNCCILRTLVSCCKEAVRLLDDFESNLDLLQPVTSYPIPYLSSDMLPSSSSTYTILSVRCKVELYECSLQYMYDIQSVMIEKCNITQHCQQLLAVRSNPTILYWTIPKCVLPFINTNVPLHSEYFY